METTRACDQAVEQRALANVRAPHDSYYTQSYTDFRLTHTVFRKGSRAQAGQAKRHGNAPNGIRQPDAVPVGTNTCDRLPLAPDGTEIGLALLGRIDAVAGSHDGSPVAQGILPDGRLQRTAVVGSLTDEFPDIVRADAFFRLAEQYGQGVQRPTARVGLVASVDLAESLFQTVQIVDLAPVYPSSSASTRLRGAIRPARSTHCRSDASGRHRPSLRPAVRPNKSAEPAGRARVPCGARES